MGINELKEEIIGVANSKASAIHKEAEQEIKKIMKDTEASIQKERQSANERVIAALDEYEKTVISKAEFESRKKILETKRSLMQKLYAEVLNELSSLSKTKCSVHIKSMISAGEKEIKIGKILCNKNDISFASPKKGEERNIAGGIIAESESGEERLDYSYENILKTVFENNLLEISALLLGKS
ncbi:MAG: V-type ATP synthase subunit E family protein [archaeon]